MLLQITGGAALAIAGIAVYAFAMGVRQIGAVIAAATTIAAFSLMEFDPTVLSAAAFIAFALGALRAQPVFGSRTVGILLAIIGAALIAVGDMRPIGELALATGAIIADLYAQVIQGALGVTDPTGGVFVLIALMTAAAFMARFITAIGDPLIASIVAFGVAYLAVYISALALVELYAAALGGLTLIPILALVVGAVAVVDMFTILQRPRPESIVWLGPLGVIAKISLGLNLAPLVGALGLIAAVTAVLSGRTSMYVTAIFLAMSTLAMA